MGYLTLLLLGGIAMAMLVLLGVRRPLWSLVGAALMLGATGYALQGRPFLPAQPARPEANTSPVDPAFIDLRDRMLGRYTAQGAYLIAADAMERSGDKGLAVQALLGGIRRYPDTLMLWVALGDALARHDGDRVSPPALFAFQHAARLAPDHPAPPFFLGVARIRAGEFAAARPLWARALALSPPAASYHRDIAVRLAVLDRYLAAAGQGGPASGEPTRE